ncbi:MAG: radical SAM/SPASM domain-containing protein [Pyrinomonadaceae bacterium]
MKKLKAYTNVLKLRVNMALKRAAIHNYPVTAIIEPTSFCNLHCPACPTGLRLDLRPTVAIKEELFKAAIDEIGDYIFQLNMYNWGEPLLHKQTPELIAYAKAKEISISLSTNLSIKLTDDYIERLVRSGLDTLVVSLDGVTEETYSKYRRNGNLALVRENVRRIHETKERLGAQTPEVVWQFLVFRHNEHEIDTVRSVYQAWGADSVSIKGAQMPIEEYGEGFEPSTMPEYNLYHPEHHSVRTAAKLMQSSRSCTWLYGAFVLNPNGKVSPCCAVPAEKHDFSEYKQADGFWAAWNSDKFRRARQMFTRSSSAPKLTAQRLIQIRKRLDGMNAGAADSLADDKLICHKCPIPDLQHYIDPVINQTSGDLLSAVWHGRRFGARAQAALYYLLMGAPNLRVNARIGARKLSAYLRPSAGQPEMTNDKRRREADHA